MNLGNLSKQVSAKSTEIRGNQAHKSCEAGYQALARASESGYENTELVTMAYEHFLQAIKFKRRMVEPYVGIAYLFLLLGQTESAEEYLNEGLRQNPDHEDAKRLLDIAIKKKGQLDDGSALPDVQELKSANLTADDYDRLYDQTEEQLKEVTLKIMQTKHPTSPSHELRALKNFDHHYKKYKALYKSIVEKIDIINEDLDVSDLRQSLRPLEQIQNRYLKLCQASHAMMKLDKEIEAVNKKVIEIKEKIQGLDVLPPSLELEKELDFLYNQSDMIADRLDDMEEKGHAISKLMPLYEKMNSKIESLSDTVDDMKA